MKIHSTQHVTTVLLTKMCSDTRLPKASVLPSHAQIVNYSCKAHWQKKVGDITSTGPYIVFITSAVAYLWVNV